MHTVQVKRIYEPAAANDGKRILVDRLWPRGLSKETAHYDLWVKDVAPSDALRHWFNHIPERWEEFKVRYFAELAQIPDTWQPIAAAIEESDVTLLFSAHDAEHNNAVALAEFLHLHAKHRTKGVKTARHA